MLTLTTLTSMPFGVDTVNMETVKPYHHGSLQTSLVEAGFELARQGGPDAVGLRAVTRAAGVSHNAAYRHFADREQLLVAVSTRCMRELALLMEARTAEVQVRDRRRRARSRLVAIGEAYVEFATTEPGWFRTAFAVTDMAGSVDGPALGVGDEGLGPYELLGARLDELVEVGELPAERRPGAEFAAWAVVHGLATLLTEGPLQGLPVADRGHAVAIALGVVQRGL
jgi:AcrR family transcriptional regulator